MTRRRPLGTRAGIPAGLALALVLAACAGSAPPVPSLAPVDPANGVTIDNGTGASVAIVYERPDGTTEELLQLPDGARIVTGDLFAGRDGLCRTGRLVARVDDADVDELYLVCKGQVWEIRPG